MKKIATLLMLFIAMFTVVVPVFAAEAAEPTPLIDLYPERGPGDTRYNQANWALEYAGYRLHFAQDHAKFLSLLKPESVVAGVVDTTDPKTIDPLFKFQYSSIGHIMKNDTNQTITVKGNADRTSMMAGANRIMVIFNAQGQPVIYENTVTTVKWVKTETGYVLATAAEIEADAKLPAEQQKLVSAAVRYVKTETGYAVEPITYLKVTTVGLEEGKSYLLNHDPRNVVLEPGAFMLAFGAIERRAENVHHLEYINNVLFDLVKGVKTAPTGKMAYTPEAAKVIIPTALDKDPQVAGIDAFVTPASTFNLTNLLGLDQKLNRVDANNKALPITGVHATWMHMFDAEGKLIYQTKFIGFEAQLFKGEEKLETVAFTYNAETDMYTGGNFTKVDTQAIGSEYTVKIVAKNGEGKETTGSFRLVVGVIPPQFVGVKDRASNEGVYVDLLEGIKSNQGLELDSNYRIVVKKPATLNTYSPKAGKYTIELEIPYEGYEMKDGKAVKVTLYARQSYVLTIDDVTAPEVHVLDNKYTISVGEYDKAEDAILANILALDNVKDQEMLYVVDAKKVDMTKPGTYTASVTVMDEAGNETVVEFNVTVVPAKASVEQVEQAVTDLTENVGDVNAVADGKVGIGAVILVSLGMSAISFAGAVLMLKKKI